MNALGVDRYGTCYAPHHCNDVGQAFVLSILGEGVFSEFFLRYEMFSGKATRLICRFYDLE